MLIDPRHIDAWNALLRGEQSSLESIYNQHFVGLLNYGIKLVSERDIVKDNIFQLLLHLWDNRHKLPAVNNVRSYLITCLHRELLAGVRKGKGKVVNTTSWEQLYPDQEFSYEEYLIEKQQNQELRHKVMLAFKKLSVREQELLRRRFFDDENYDDIASHCNITKRTAYNIIHGALKSLKSSLTGEVSNRRKAAMVLTALKSILF